MPDKLPFLAHQAASIHYHSISFMGLQYSHCMQGSQGGGHTFGHSSKPSSLMGFTGNRDRIDAEVGVRGLV